MAAVSLTCIGFGTLSADNQIIGRSSSLVSFGRTMTSSFPCIRTSRLRICAAKAETLEKVSGIVRKQLALSEETQLTPQTKFSELGADSLDTVEIVMGLEEAFDISVEEENSENITTIQEAADLIDKLVDKKC
ncbi:acyl carrier protein 4 chloroplastic [Phtheirospermum japonicum]|uniref:Acyl carrier protein n=1 Tax=Phtheirospermum japonicum TaxID=374723 RepID=A0A830C5G5_9LAMI|nr:acyl carrier protein 4 chloroplastic [Phtheirospermum japonicum]